MTTSGALDDTSGPTFTNNTMSGNGGYPVRVPAASVHQLDATSSYTGNGDDYVYVFNDTLDQDATWQLLDVDYYVAGSIYVQDSGTAPLWTVEDGVSLYMASNTGLYIGHSYGGELEVLGTSAGVTFTSASGSPMAGDWYGLYLGSSDRDSVIDGLTLGYAGKASSYPAGVTIYSDAELSNCTIHDNERNGIYVTSAAAPIITDSEISDNDEAGIHMVSAAKLGGDFTGNTLSGNGDEPITVPANYVGMLDASSSFSGNGDDMIQVLADTVDSDATWQALDVDYEIGGNVTVQGTSGPTLSIEDGVTLEFRSGVSLNVGTSYAGALELQGDYTTGSGVTLTSAQSAPAAGDWRGLYFGNSTRESATVLSGFTLEYAGSSPSYPGSVYMSYVDLEFSDCYITDGDESGIYLYQSTAAVSDCEISGHTDDGIYMSASSGLSGAFTNNVLSGNDYPIRLPANYLGSLDSSSSFTGNATDYIYVLADTVSDDATWELLDVDYYISGNVYIEDTAGVVVDTSNTTFEFASNTGFFVGRFASGTFTADGATFTSAQSSPAAGDWRGLYFGNAVTSSTEINNCTISYGGGYNANLYLYYSDPVITGNTIENSSSWGVYNDGSGSPTVSGNSYSSNASGDSYGI